jgi:hypothetical protein
MLSGQAPEQVPHWMHDLPAEALNSIGVVFNRALYFYHKLTRFFLGILSRSPNSSCQQYAYCRLR